MSMRKLAEILQVHYSTVGKIEQGKRKLDILEYLEY